MLGPDPGVHRLLAVGQDGLRSSLHSADSVCDLSQELELVQGRFTVLALCQEQCMLSW